MTPEEIIDAREKERQAIIARQYQIAVAVSYAIEECERTFESASRTLGDLVGGGSRLDVAVEIPQDHLRLLDIRITATMDVATIVQSGTWTLHRSSYYREAVSRCRRLPCQAHRNHVEQERWAFSLNAALIIDEKLVEPLSRTFLYAD